MAQDGKELKKIYSGFMSARVLLTANNLGIFNHLKRAQTAEALARTLGADRRATTILLDALCSIGLLSKQAEKYRNTPLANKYLIDGTAEYQGDIIRHMDTLWKNWSALDEVMITGRPAGRSQDHCSFILGMHNLAVLRLRETMRSLRLKNVRKALDLGSGPGTYAVELAKKGVSVTMFDYPETIKIAKKLAGKYKVKGIRFIEGDFTADSIGVGYDLILLSQILHAYSEKDNMALLEKCHKALNPGGRVVVVEMPLRKDHTSPQQGALFSVNMLLATEGGRSYSAEEMSGMLLETGFAKVLKKQLSDTVLIEAVKAAR